MEYLARSSIRYTLRCIVVGRGDFRLMTVHEYTLLLLSLGVLLFVARALGELADRFGQPTILGEIAAGILVGPTILGRIAPDTVA